ncbi:MAG: hypothetical protein LH654_05170 [Thermoleophilia bacterium]|nr:hypothetical protein [Thermoleophilia bacterium]
MVANEPSSPSRIIAGRYRLGSRLGSGLEAAVFEAFDQELQRTVVLKLVQRSSTPLLVVQTTGG